MFKCYHFVLRVGIPTINYYLRSHLLTWFKKRLNYCPTLCSVACIHSTAQTHVKYIGFNMLLQERL